jgi:predicted MFS family arabinose efflux permease
MGRGQLAAVTVAAFLGSLPIFAVPVLLLIVFLESTSSPAHATVLVGVYALANAIGLPVQGRFMVRFDHRLVLGIAAAVHAAALLALPYTNGVGLAMSCAVAGLAFPEINASLRALLVRSEEGARGQKRLSISVASFEVAAVTGPLLGAWASTAPSPAAALAVSAGWMATVTGLYVVAIRGIPPMPADQTVVGRKAPDWVLVVFAVAPAACYSLLAAAAGLAAATQGHTVMIGVVRAALSTGALLGAVWLSLRPSRSPRRALINGFLLLASISLLATVTAKPFATVGLFLVGGCAFTPIAVSMTLLVDKTKAAATIGVLHAAAILSGGLFTALAGPLYAREGTTIPYWTSVAMAVVGAAVAARYVATPGNPRGVSPAATTSASESA